jgi:uncharacterized membrane protein YhhN
VNAATAIAFVAASIFAVGDWIAVSRENKRLEYLCKPATLAALVVAACVLDPAADAGARRAWFVAALVFSLAGDVFLMLPSDQFVAGLAAFLAGHVCYTAGFIAGGLTAGAVLVGVVLAAAVVYVLGRRILAALRDQPEVRGPVVAYMAAIGSMLATAVASANPWAAVGAASFVGSDALIAWNRFVRPVARAGLVIMVTYHLGQALLVASLLL